MYKLTLKQRLEVIMESQKMIILKDVNSKTGLNKDLSNRSEAKSFRNVYELPINICKIMRNEGNFDEVVDEEQ